MTCPMLRLSTRMAQECWAIQCACHGDNSDNVGQDEGFADAAKNSHELLFYPNNSSGISTNVGQKEGCGLGSVVSL